MGKKVYGLLGHFPLLLSGDPHRVAIPWLSPNPDGMPACVVVGILGMEEQKLKKNHVLVIQATN